MRHCMTKIKREMLIPQEAQGVLKIISILRSGGYEAYITGGAVRDFLLGKTPEDYDIASSAAPQEVKLLCDDFAVADTGLKHGTVTVGYGKMNFEVTTFRCDGEYSDNRKPDSVRFVRSARIDAERRDFTVNALFYDPETAEVIDYTGGIKDIEKKIIRTVGDPCKRFSEDALRIMRAARFASVLRFDIEKGTEETALAMRERLCSVSRERIRDELLKLLCGEGAENVICRYPEIIAEAVPGIEKMKGFSQNSRYHCYDLLIHTARVVSGVSCRPYMRMAALLHDIGKLTTRKNDSEGYSHFKGHAPVSVKLSAEIMNNLRFDNSSKRKILTLVKYHDTHFGVTRAAVRKRLYMFGEEMFFDIMELKLSDNAAKNTAVSDRSPEYREIIAKAHSIIDEKECFRLSDLAVNGRDLKSEGISGREIGTELKRLMGEVLNGKTENEREALLKNFREKRK